MFENITIVGTGYVGLSMATLLSQTRKVIALDIIESKVNDINNRISPIEDSKIKNMFETKSLSLYATLDKSLALNKPDLVIIATPTDYDEKTNKFNTSSIESVINDAIQFGLDVPIVIKSTIPIGYVEYIKNNFSYKGEIFFSPEFLREGRALEDNLNPSRIVIGSKSKAAFAFANLLKNHALNKEKVEIFAMEAKEAEAVKLFANTYLAMRVSFFNELDTFAEVNALNSSDIIRAVSADRRIGDHYNNPSFGYGGYCLPKDTKQLEANYEGVPQNIITAIVASNETRKKHIAEMILKKEPKTVGIYRLVMKTGSDNFRQSSILGVINLLVNKGIKVIVFEPHLTQRETELEVEADLDKFIKESDVIITNRFDEKLSLVKDKVYTRDAFNRD